MLLCKQSIFESVSNIPGSESSAIVLLFRLFTGPALAYSPVSVNDGSPLIKQAHVYEIDIPHWAIAGPPHLATVFSSVQKPTGDYSRAPALLIIGTLERFVDQFHANTQVFPLKPVHFIVSVLPQGIIVAVFDIIGGGAPRGRPGLNCLTLRKKVEKLADGDHLDFCGSFTVGQERHVLPS